MRTFDEYLAEFDSLLNVDRKSRSSIIKEIQDHLIESVESGTTSGISKLQAESNAISTFGSPALIARNFNAAFGAKAVRKAPMVAIVSGLLVVFSFLLAVINQPEVVRPAIVDSQITFFFAVIAFQVAIVAGACGASRALATWRTSATSGSSRLYVRRCTVTSMSALLIGVFSMSTNFIFDFSRNSQMNRFALILGALSMFYGAGVGLLIALKLKINPTDEDLETNFVPSPVLFTLGESIIKLVRRFPIISCLVATSIASAWMMTQSDTTTLAAAWPWGVAEAISVIAGFAILGPTLELRSTRSLKLKNNRG